MSGLGSAAFKLAYQDSPILLQNGIANNIPGKILPIIALTALTNLTGTLSDALFAAYKPLPGSTLIDIGIAEYPFANLVMAANATVQNPLTVSMLMECPTYTYGSLITKQAALTALQYALQTHINLGGSFIVITPAYTYFNMLMTCMRDVGSPSEKKVQETYQLDFVQPLLTQSQAQQVLGALASKLQGNLPTPLSYTSPGTSGGGLSP